jgi:hypothetical protein
LSVGIWSKSRAIREAIDFAVFFWDASRNWRWISTARCLTAFRLWPWEARRRSPRPLHRSCGDKRHKADAVDLSEL